MQPSIQLGTPHMATIMILDDDHGGIFSFDDAEVEVVESVGTFELELKRISGARGKVAIPYNTEDGTAKEGEHYEAQEGELVARLRSHTTPRTARPRKENTTKHRRASSWQGCDPIQHRGRHGQGRRTLRSTGGRAHLQQRDIEDYQSGDHRRGKLREKPDHVCQHWRAKADHRRGKLREKPDHVCQHW